MIRIVLGPPCAGKSAYVDAHKADGDVSVDFDRLARALGSTVAHGSTGAPRVVAFAARQAAINRILRGVESDAWIIHTNPSADALQEYVDAGAEIVVVDPGAEECHARAKRDGRPEATHQAIDAWYANPPTIPEARKAMSTKSSTDGKPMTVGAMRTFVDGLTAELVEKFSAVERRIGELEKKPALKYCGTYDLGKHYTTGSAVTKGGALFVAKVDTDTAPGDSAHWQLAVRRGAA